MGRIVVMNHVTLDGVMQGPGRPDEDTRGGFAHSGWGRPPGSSEDVAKAMGDDVAKAMSERMAAGGGLAGWLFGRRTYEDLLSYWNQQPDSRVWSHAQQRIQVRRVDHTQGAAAVAKLHAAARRHR